MITMDREWLSQKILIILFNFYLLLFIFLHIIFFVSK